MSRYRNDDTATSGVSLIGSDFAELFFASKRDDRLEGRGGGDVIFARGGDDTIIGGRGNDIVVAGDGDDEAIWNNGDGSDLVFGGRGHDRQTVNLADDAGDAITLTNIGSFVQLARTNLGVFSLNLFDTEALAVNGGGGDDSFTLANDVAAAIELEIDGGADGADHRRADDAGDIAQGDTVDLSSFATGVLVDLDENNQGVLQAENDLSNATDAGLSEFGKIEVDGEVVVEQLDDVENAVGTAFDDTLFGNSQNNVLLGSAGDDRLHPFGGDDFVDGGTGTDTLLLNGFPKGSDVDVADGVAQFLDGSAGVNTFANIENVNGSTVAGDLIKGDDRADIAQDVNFTLNGDVTEVNGNILNGLGGDDVIFGGAGNDQLIGGDNVDRARADAQGQNADTLAGGAGNDFLIGGAGRDTFAFAAGEGPDVIDDFEIGLDRIALDAPSFDVHADEVAFQNVARDGHELDAGLVDVEGGNTVYVLQGAFEGNAGGAADALAGALAGNDVDEGAGFFVYFNTGQQINRVFHTDDLDDADADIALIANLGQFNGDGALGDPEEIQASLAEFEADNFTFDAPSAFDSVA